MKKFNLDKQVSKKSAYIYYGKARYKDDDDLMRILTHCAPFVRVSNIFLWQRRHGKIEA